MKRVVAYSPSLDIVIDDRSQVVYLSKVGTRERTEETFNSCVDASRAAQNPEALVWI